MLKDSLHLTRLRGDRARAAHTRALSGGQRVHALSLHSRDPGAAERALVQQVV